MEATSLSNTNSTKILESEDELSSSLRDAVGEMRLKLHRSPKMRCCLLAIDSTLVVGCYKL